MINAIVVTHSPPNSPSKINGATLRFQQLLASLNKSSINSLVFTIGSGLDFDIDLGELSKSSLDRPSNKSLTNLDRLKKSITSLNKEDLLIIDQPFIWQYIFDTKSHSKVIYSSHNHESDVQLQLARLFGFAGKQYSRWKEVHEWETKLVQRSDMIICCTIEDLRKYQIDCVCPVVSVPNVIESAFAPDIQHRSSTDWVYVSSDWIANWIALPLLIDPSVLHKHGIKLKLVGKCISALENDHFGNKWVQDCGGSIVKVGIVDAQELSEILNHSYGSIIPILLGGGSNLKLAEALAYKHRVITTSFGARGRGYIENLNLANSRQAFSDFFSKASDLNIAVEDCSHYHTMDEAVSAVLELKTH